MMDINNLIPKSTIPESECGNWRVDKFAISEEQAMLYNINARGRGVDAGDYTRLRNNDAVIMSDTPAEIRDHYAFVSRAFGNVLINGLGLGLVLQGLLNKKNITSVTVIEIDIDVISLIGKYFSDQRLTIIHADALIHMPPKGEKYHAVWHDIWANICLDNVGSISTLNRKYGKRLHPRGFQGYWAQPEIENIKERSRRSIW